MGGYIMASDRGEVLIVPVKEHLDSSKIVEQFSRQSRFGLNDRLKSFANAKSLSSWLLDRFGYSNEFSQCVGGVSWFQSFRPAYFPVSANSRGTTTRAELLLLLPQESTLK
jgi:hypothetical protein